MRGDPQALSRPEQAGFQMVWALHLLSGAATDLCMTDPLSRVLHAKHTDVLAPRGEHRKPRVPVYTGPVQVVSWDALQQGEASPTQR